MRAPARSSVEIYSVYKTRETAKDLLPSFCCGSTYYYNEKWA